MHHFHQECLLDIKNYLHIYMSLLPPLSPHLEQLLGLSHHISYTWNRQLPVNLFFYLLCNEGHFPEFTIIFPPLIPTINLVFPAFTFNPLSIMLALHSVTCLPSCSIVGAIRSSSSAYRNWPLMQTRICSNYSANLWIQCKLIHTHLPQNPSQNLSRDSIKFLL